MASRSFRRGTALLLNEFGMALLAWGTLATAHGVGAQEWTRFRGPNGSGISTAKIPEKWSDDVRLWKTDLPGAGHSSPVVWGGRVFLTSAEAEGAKRNVLCLDAETGKIVWSRGYDMQPHHKHVLNSFASATAAIDSDRVYVSFTEPDHQWLLALDHAGTEQWRHDLGPFASQHSGGTSPVCVNDLVVLGNEQDGTSKIVALDAATGRLRWETPRRTDMVSYSTPCLYQPADGRAQLVFLSSAHGIAAVEPASGRPLWETTVFDKRTCSSPVIAGEMILGTCGSGGGGTYVVSVRPGTTADGPFEEVFRIAKGAPYVPTPVVAGSRLYLWNEKGVVTCAHVEDGSTVWQERVGGNFFSSPILCGDRLLCVSDQGEAVQVQAGDTFAERGRNALDDECRSTPAVSGGKLFIRTATRLHCIRTEPEVAGRPAER